MVNQNKENSGKDQDPNEEAKQFALFKVTVSFLEVNIILMTYKDCLLEYV